MCYLLFIEEQPVSINVKQLSKMTDLSVKNVEAFKVILGGFENTDSTCDMKTELLHTIRAILSLDRTSMTISHLGVLEPFKVFFLQFDGLSMGNKNLVLTMMDEVLTKAELLPEELRAYCLLLQGTRHHVHITNSIVQRNAPALCC